MFDNRINPSFLILMLSNKKNKKRFKYLYLLFKIQTQRSQESQFKYWEIKKVYPFVFIEIVAEIQKF